MNLASVDLNLLVAFDAIMMERNVTRASARVGRTQPAMSNALKRLRELTGDEPFIRSAEGLQPTRRAIDLHEEVGRALAGIDAALSSSHRFEPGSADMTFTIAMSDHPTFSCFCPGSANGWRWMRPESGCTCEGSSIGMMW